MPVVMVKGRKETVLLKMELLIVELFERMNNRCYLYSVQTKKVFKAYQSKLKSSSSKSSLFRANILVIINKNHKDSSKDMFPNIILNQLRY